MSSEVHINNVGTRFLVTIKDDDTIVNVSGASLINMVFKKPSDTIMTKTGLLFTDGTDGKIYHDSIVGDLDEAGYYKLQAKIAFPSGTYYTDIYTFQVFCNI